MQTCEILLCQSERELAYELERRIEGAGHVVTSISLTGEDALDFAKSTEPDLAVLDLNLPGELNGIETAQRLALEFNIPSIYLFDDSDLHLFETDSLNETMRYLVKPIQDQELHARIQSSLTLRKRQGAATE